MYRTYIAHIESAKSRPKMRRASGTVLLDAEHVPSCRRGTYKEGGPCT